MRLRPTIDALCPTESPISHGTIVELLVLNRLLSPKPLVHVGRWVADTGLDVLLGVDPVLLNDDRIGRTLDALAEVIGCAPPAHGDETPATGRERAAGARVGA